MNDFYQTTVKIITERIQNIFNNNKQKCINEYFMIFETPVIAGEGIQYEMHKRKITFWKVYSEIQNPKIYRFQNLF